MDKRDLILSYLHEKYYQPNLSAEVARNLNMAEDELIDQIDLINRENNGLIVVRDGMGKNKFVLSLRPNSEQEINDFLAKGGYSKKERTAEQEAPVTAAKPPTINTSPKNNGGKWIAIIALVVALAALGLSVYIYLLIAGFL